MQRLQSDGANDGEVMKQLSVLLGVDKSFVKIIIQKHVDKCRSNWDQYIQSAGMQLARMPTVELR